jgi:hypothetical protein
MIKLPAGLQFQKFPRVAGYALLAALITGTLFAAEGAYRWYGATSAQMVATGEPSVAASEPVLVEATAAASPLQVPAQPSETARVKQQVEEQPVTAQAPEPAGGTIESLAAGPASSPVVGTIPSGSTSNIASTPAPEAASAPAEAAPQLAQPKSSRQFKQKQARRLPAKQATRDRATPRRSAQAGKPPVQAEKPNVYWERDSQLGFAPQLRKRTCNPATGQMPMQCYYPREGREKFPARPVN